MLGYDFMVDEDLNVWLIEVNSSPSMEYSTHVTSALVPQVLTELPVFIFDHANGRERIDTTGELPKIGNFELIYKQ